MPQQRSRLACPLLCWALLLAPALHADDRTQKLARRLAEEASTFARMAPQFLGQETLHQRALKAPPRFRPRIGEAAKGPPKATWQERTLVSEYTLSLFASDDAAGGLGTFHELRQVTTRDGKKIADSKNAQEMLAKAVTATDDERRIQLLKDFERHGLLGAVTGVGPMLLLFSARDLPRYELLFLRTDKLDGDPVLVFSYRQIDGEGLSVFDAHREDQPQHLQVYGEIWVREPSYTPLRITLAASKGEGESLFREEARVDYIMSQWGALVPRTAEHRELRAGSPVLENRFEYAPFHRFGASSDIQFDAATPTK